MFGQVSSYNGVHAVTERIDDVTSTGFNVHMQEEENLQDGHVPESFDWIAMQFGTTDLIDVALTSAGERRTDITFADRENVALLADMQTELGTNTAVMRYDNLTSNGAEIWVEEERSFDQEIFHLPEEVAVLTASTGVYDFIA